MCNNRWLAPANKKLDAEARRRYESDETREPAQWSQPTSNTKVTVTPVAVDTADTTTIARN